VESRANGGFILWHLGMSGSIAVVDTATSVQKHDHLDIVLDDESVIRYHDPRRFGCVLWILGEMPTHSLLDSLGPEPLSDAFDAQYLFEVSRGRTASVKEFIMASSTVVGVGNIYASESLFTAKIRPTTAAGRVSRERYTSLVLAIKDTLAKAIAAGGSSLRNYVQADGNSGYFQLDALVYGRQSQPCRVCGTPIRSIRQGQRSTYYCPRCQT
jgi:formamidopyrimidine-DNA glycosylase